MTSLNEVLSSAEQHCKAKGVRFTEKRKQVLSGLVLSQCALSAYELLDYCNTELGESLTAMSVYRILEFLETEQLVHKLSTANKYVACAHITCAHTHGAPQFLICDQCKHVKEIVIDQNIIRSLEQNINDAGYSLMSQQLEMNCLCQSCSEKAA